MEARPTPPGAPGSGTRGRLACALLGAGYFLAALFGGGLVGMLFYFLISPIYKREREDWYYLQNEGQSLVTLMFLAGAVVGAWCGMRCYKPAAMVASGKRPKPSFLTESVLYARRGLLALLGMYFVPRWELLTGETNAPWRILPRVVAGVTVVVGFMWPVMLGRDSEFFQSAWVCGGVSLIIADCLLVNQISQWRANNQLKPL